MVQDRASKAGVHRVTTHGRHTEFDICRQCSAFQCLHEEQVVSRQPLRGAGLMPYEHSQRSTRY
jgi:hypothetical protein